MICRWAQARPTGQLGGEGKARSHQLAAEIIERERNHELLLSTKNLQELGISPFPYIVHVLPNPLPAELVKGQHFVFSELLKLIPGSSS